MISLKWLTVNLISTVRIVAAAVIVYLAAHSMWWAVFAIAVIGFVSDFIDGRLARYWHVSSPFGIFFDPLTDKILCLAIIAVISVVISPLFWVMFVIFAIYDVTTMSLRVLMSKLSPMPTSYIAKLKTALLMISLLLIIISLAFEPGVLSAVVLVFGTILLIVASILTVMSLVKYLRYVSHQTIHKWLEFPVGVGQIDFKKWHTEYGINAVFFDIEGTLTHWAGTKVEDDITAVIQNARAAGIKHIGLISNIHSSQSERVNKIASQINADDFQLPIGRGQAKPSTKMAYNAFNKLGVTPDEAAFAGDKLVDVIIGKRTGMKRVAWVGKLGAADHPFDRFVYRYFERMIKFIIR